MKAAVSVLGKDQVGIISKVSALLAQLIFQMFPKQLWMAIS